MRANFRRKKSIGQSVTEYAVLLAVAAAALIAMQVYLKRGVQGRIRDLADQISPTQYEPGSTFSCSEINQIGNAVRQLGSKDVGAISQRGVSRTNQYETITRNVYEKVSPETQ